MQIKTIQASEEMIKAINELPQEVVFKKPGKGDLDYVSITYVIDTLNAAFGHLGWSVELLDTWVQNYIPYFKKKSNYFKPTKEQGAIMNSNLEEGVFITDQAPVAWAKVRLTVKVYDEQTKSMQVVSKEAVGSKVVIGMSGEQEHIFKSAESDAIKKAASMFGIGLDLARKPAEKEHYLNLNKKPIWTEALKEEYKEFWTYVNDLCSTNSWSYDDLSYYVFKATNETEGNILYMAPEYTQAFITAVTEG